MAGVPRRDHAKQVGHLVAAAGQAVAPAGIDGIADFLHCENGVFRPFRDVLETVHSLYRDVAETEGRPRLAPTEGAGVENDR